MKNQFLDNLKDPLSDYLFMTFRIRFSEENLHMDEEATYVLANIFRSAMENYLKNFDIIIIEQAVEKLQLEAKILAGVELENLKQDVNRFSNEVINEAKKNNFVIVSLSNLFSILEKIKKIVCPCYPIC